MKRFWRNLVALMGVAVGLAAGGRAWGEQVTYYVDPARSSLTLSGNWYGDILVPRGKTGLFTSYTGAIIANRDIGADTLQFTGGSIVAQNGVGVWAGQPTNYDFKPAESVTPGAATNYFAIQEFTFNTHSAEIHFPSSFDASQLLVEIQTGKLDFYFGYTDITGAAPMSGVLALVPANGTLLRTDSVETLTIPFDSDFSVLIDVEGYRPVSLPMHLSGSIVAVAPEPGSILLLLLPAVFSAKRSRIRSQ